jgi:N-acetylated-alpha-linked acidic dipeptidase
MKPLRRVFSLCLCTGLLGAATPQIPRGFAPSTAERELRNESLFLDIPSAAGAHQNAVLVQRRPHYAGSDGDHQLAIAMRDQLAADGFDATLETTVTRVDTPQKLVLEFAPDGKRESGRTAAKHLIRLSLREVPEPSDPATANGEISTPFNFGAADGDIWAPLVYASRGREEDYATLAAAHIDVRGAIVLVRYGAQFRGLLAEHAQAHGAAGVIFYSDPKDDGFARGATYPHGPWRPLTAVQRGTVGENIHIPTLPISAANAKVLLETFPRGSAGPDGWAGALAVPYTLARAQALVHLVVHLNRKQTTLWNTVARLHGIDDTHAVILGGHRDAWVYGVSDNGDGVTTMLEVARGLGYLAKSGWRPQRTIVICGWDGEEIGEVGSNAFVRDHAAELQSAVAYLNADENITGGRFAASGAAAIAPLIIEATHVVADPAANHASVFDRWNTQPTRAPRAGAASLVEIPGGGSDHEPFLFTAGIPIANMGFEGRLGVYHSSYDTLNYAEHFADPGFALHRTIAQVYGIVAMRLADADVIPYAFGGYTPVLRAGYLQLVAKSQRSGLALDLASLKTSIDAFADAARRFDAGSVVLKDTSTSELLAVRDIDRVAYGAIGYDSSVFPAINAALDAQRADDANVALTRATAAIAEATHALVGT